MKLKQLLYLIFISFSIAGIGQSGILDYQQLSQTYGLKHMHTLRAFLSLPCDANFKDDILKNVDWVENQFEQRGFTSLRLETPTVPVLLLQKMSDNTKAKTLMFYFHADGQPVVPKEWSQEDPFVPVLKKQNPETKKWEEVSFESQTNNFDPELRIFARAASDDKGPGVMLLAALDAIFDAGSKPNYNIKILVDFEEEKGSTSLPAIVSQYKDLLKTDLLLILDGPAHDSNLPTLSFGSRGIVTVTLTTYGSYSALHSGHFGNYVPNPAWRMVKLLSTMKTSSGKVVIQGFYDGVKIDKTTKDYLKTIPDNVPSLHKRLGIKRTDKVGESYRESLMYPSLNIRGLKSGEVADLAGTIVPEKAVAEIDIRTVTQTPPDSLVKKLKSHILKHGYHIIDHDPTPDERAKYENLIKIQIRPPYGAFSTDISGSAAKWLESAIAKTTSEKVLKLPLMGGSLPITPFVTQLGVQAIILPTVNSDNNQHSFDENLRLGNFVGGIKTLIGILSTDF
ncbi:MAG TPA: M20/M25/M40 family metallo-hydrolase [Saprospiraceae bacterium]|nr:M20/M25/M40 family metallo-hydrolase [Saprospiraceae bacterium]